MSLTSRQRLGMLGMFLADGVMVGEVRKLLRKILNLNSLNVVCIGSPRHTN